MLANLSKQLVHRMTVICVCQFVSKHSYALHNHALSVQLANLLLSNMKIIANWYDDA